MPITYEAHTISPNTQEGPPVSRSSPNEQVRSRFQWVLLSIGNELAKRSLIFIIAALAAKLFFPFMAYPFIGMTAGIITATLIGEAFTHLSPTLLGEIRYTITSYATSRYSYTPLAILIAAIAISYFSPWMSFGLTFGDGSVEGIYHDVKITLSQRDGEW